jgi:hypothetical protein
LSAVPDKSVSGGWHRSRDRIASDAPNRGYLTTGADRCSDIPSQLGNTTGTGVNRVTDLNTPVVKILAKILDLALESAGADEVRLIRGVVLEAIDRHRLPLF